MLEYTDCVSLQQWLEKSIKLEEFCEIKPTLVQQVKLTVQTVCGKNTGRELGIVFNEGMALRLCISKGSYLVFAAHDSVAQAVVDQAPLTMKTVTGNTLLLVDEGVGRSVVVFQPELVWDVYGPDILLESALFSTNLTTVLSTQSDYLRQITLLEALLDPCLFNGFGPLLVNEILQRLYYYFEIRPFINARQFLKHDHNRNLLQRMSTEFIGQFLHMSSLALNCVDFMDFGWLDLRSVLLFSFRQQACRETTVSWYSVALVSQKEEICYSTCESVDLPQNWRKMATVLQGPGLSHYFAWQKSEASHSKRKALSTSEMRVKKPRNHQSATPKRETEDVDSMFVPYCDVLCNVTFPDYSDDCTESEDESSANDKEVARLKRRFNKKCRRIANKFKHKIKL